MTDTTTDTTADTTTTDTTADTTTTDTTTAQSPEWLASLPDELKGDATLARFKDVPALAAAHVEQHKTIKTLQGTKLMIPGADAGDEEWGKVFDAIGRPADPNDYDIKTIELPVDAPEDQRAALAEATKPFKELAHKLGLTAKQATALSQFDLERTAAFYAKGQEDVAALKAKLGKDYEPKAAAAQQAFAQVFGRFLGEEEAQQFAQELDRKVGSGVLIQGMMRLSEIMGEHNIIETDTVDGLGEVKDAEGKLTELRNDPTWRQKRNAGDQATINQEKRLLKLAVQQAQRRG